MYLDRRFMGGHPFRAGAGSVDTGSVFVAWIMIFANTVAGYLLFEYAFDRESQVFTIAVFGGLVFRLLLLMGLVALLF